MNNNSETNYLIQVKKILIDEIRILEATTSNECFLSSLPIQSTEIRTNIIHYNASNNYVDLGKILSEKRKVLTNVNLTLNNICKHKVITGHLKISHKNNKTLLYIKT